MNFVTECLKTVLQFLQQQSDAWHTSGLGDLLTSDNKDTFAFCHAVGIRCPHSEGATVFREDLWDIQEALALQDSDLEVPGWLDLDPFAVPVDFRCRETSVLDIHPVQEINDLAVNNQLHCLKINYFLQQPGKSLSS